MGKKCIKIIDKSGMLVKWVHRSFEERQSRYGWKVMNRSREELEWDAR